MPHNQLEPFIMIRHAQKPVLVCSTGEVYPLGRMLRFMLWAGITSIQKVDSFAIDMLNIQKSKQKAE